MHVCVVCQTCYKCSLPTSLPRPILVAIFLQCTTYHPLMFLSTKETRSDWRSPPWKHWSCSCRVSVHRFSVFRRQNLKTETIAWEWDPCKVSRAAITEHGTEAAFQSNVMGCNKLDNRVFPQKRLISISLFAALCSSLSFHSLWHFYTEKGKKKI